jgi:hypothetical protein
MNLEYPVQVSVNVLGRLWNPFHEKPWEGTTEFGFDSVRYALENQLFVRQPDVSEMEHYSLRANGSDADSARVAFFVKYGWSDPIEIDVGVPMLGCYLEWPVCDGNHRLAAAIYSGMPYIKAEISGQVDYAVSLLRLGENV